MRMLSAVVLASAGVFGVAPPAPAGESAAARAVIERAIKAHGGESALARAQTLSRTGSGVMALGGRDMPFTEESVLALPGRSRITVDLDRRYQITLAVHGDRGWQSTGGATLDLGKERVEELQEEVYVLWVATLLPLRKETFTLTPLPDDKGGNGRPASVVKVASKGHFDVKLYFDKETHLLTKAERRAKEAGLPLDKTYLFDDYKDVEGVKMPGRYVELLNGKKLTERKTASYKLLRGVDDSTFTKP